METGRAQQKQPQAKHCRKHNKQKIIPSLGKDALVGTIRLRVLEKRNNYAQTITGVSQWPNVARGMEMSVPLLVRSPFFVPSFRLRKLVAMGRECRSTILRDAREGNPDPCHGCRVSLWLLGSTGEDGDIGTNKGTLGKQNNIPLQKASTVMAASSWSTARRAAATDWEAREGSPYDCRKSGQTDVFFQQAEREDWME
jgi:hypothetical protein